MCEQQKTEIDNTEFFNHICDIYKDTVLKADSNISEIQDDNLISSYKDYFSNCAGFCRLFEAVYRRFDDFKKLEQPIDTQINNRLIERMDSEKGGFFDRGKRIVDGYHTKIVNYIESQKRFERCENCEKIRTIIEPIFDSKCDVCKFKPKESTNQKNALLRVLIGIINCIRERLTQFLIGVLGSLVAAVLFAIWPSFSMKINPSGTINAVEKKGYKVVADSTVNKTALSYFDAKSYYGKIAETFLDDDD